MPKLSDTQAILLAHAAQNDSGSLYPLPDTLRRGGGIAKAIAALAGAGYAEERETSARSAVCRTDGDLRYGVFATAAGLAAIGITDDAREDADLPPAVAPTAAPAAASARVTKARTVVALLQRTDGATLSELIAATGWLPHTTRAALTGLRKKGHAIVRCSRDGATCYRINAVCSAVAAVAA